ncbi:bifunctional phosphoserine phosphatase/homoserine phosphotransferase ThrH [Desulfosarcina ovata]|uniref:phosphoserine phosphatase n=1 Tax=Desulfosarcina ovata subsp. ovata TaxID=2752305 RepID=A0A5K8AJR3_9BACT|nr:bifunctional phosphoserine phosphatase/homoserine phosphotransferase ThrH [Desulfosarcina ovata]BBO92040.1 phosphoserine phosphatase ThrH [Desulfosarcina ovata subsp. ovata]
MHIICSDLEGVFIPEIWINVAERTGIEELRLTTRDISDYDVLMKRRLSILEANRLKLKDITDVIATMELMPGAREFLDWLRARTQVIVVSDTFVEFARPMMEKLGWPTLLCHGLTIDAGGAIADYNLRQPDGKRKVVQAFKNLNYEVLAMGDSYNDVNMLKEAQQGILFRPPQNVIDEYPQFPVATTYDELKVIFGKALGEGVNREV